MNSKQVGVLTVFIPHIDSEVYKYSLILIPIAKTHFSPLEIMFKV